jgi:MFS family permease
VFLSISAVAAAHHLLPAATGCVQAGVQSEAVASAAVGVINVAGTVVAASLMDKAGRKQLLTLSFVGMGVSMLAMSAGLSLPVLAVSGAIDVQPPSVHLLACPVASGCAWDATVLGPWLHLRCHS